MYIAPKCNYVHFEIQASVQTVAFYIYNTAIIALFFSHILLFHL